MQLYAIPDSRSGLSVPARGQYGQQAGCYAQRAPSPQGEAAARRGLGLPVTPPDANGRNQRQCHSPCRAGTLDGRTVQLALTQGSVVVRVRELPAGQRFEIDTPKRA